MENSLRLVSEIIAGWNRNKALFFIALFFCLSFQIQAQKETEEHQPLEGKELNKFNELFFMAEKEHNLGNIEKARSMYLDLYKMTSFNATVCYRLAEIYTGNRNSESALFYAERAVSLDPENKWFKLGLAAVCRNFHFAEKEIEVLKQLIELEPENPDYRFDLSVAYHNNEQPKKAIKELDKLEEIIGINSLISEQKKQIFLDQGDIESAAKELRKLIEAYPKELNYYGILGQMYKVNGLEKEALEVYNTMLEIAPNDPRPHLDLADYYRDKGKTEKSISHLKRALNSPNLDIDQKIPTLLSLYSATEFDTVLKKEAYEMLEGVLEINSNDPKAYSIYGDFLSRDGRNHEALAAYKKAVNLDGGNKFQIWEQILLIEIQTEMFDSLAVDGPRAVERFPNQPMPYLFSGLALINVGEMEEAIDYLEEGLNYVIGNRRLKEQFYTQLADVCHRLEQHNKSDGYFDKALAINSQNPTVLNNYAYYLSVRGKKLEQALDMTIKSNALSPENPTFLDTWAWVLYKKGNYAEALDKIERVVQLMSKPNSEILEHYGDILVKNDQKAKALEQYQKAKNLGKASKDIDQKIKALSAP